jgi:predicted RND superfamily exporter protein
LGFKEKFFRGVVKHRKAVIIIFLAAVVIFALCKQFVKVNYDMTDYLPDDTASTISLDVMKKEFGSSIPNARVMIHNVTIPQALRIKKQLLHIDGVSDVVWLDDSVDTTIPLETIDSKIVENYYKNNSALFNVTIEEDKRIKAVKAIQDLIGKDNAMTGSAVNTAIATLSTTKEILRITAIAVPFTLLVLILTTTSWFEPIIFLMSIGIAIALNAGSNILFGEISFVTNAAGSILQLAVSLDYSVFLLHRFREIREEGIEPKEAMIQALCKSASSILSSGLTTVIGFLALVIMKFGIGPDLGYALAKGIALSLITVFILTPVLTLYCYKLIDLTSHKSFLPKFNKFGYFISRITVMLAVLFFFIVVPSYLGSINNTYYYSASYIFNNKTKSGQDTKKIEDVYGKLNTYVLMVPKGDFAREKELSDSIKNISQVSSVLSYVDNVGAEIPTQYLDDNKLSKLIGRHYSRMIITAKTGYEGKEAFGTVEKMRAVAAEFYPDTYYLAGETVSTYDLMDTITSDNIKVNLIAVGSVFVILIIFMKSISLPVLLVLAIETAVWLNFSINYFAGKPLFFIGYLIISSVQLGATVDYAILLTDRYKEFRESYQKKEAIQKTISVVTASILTSATVMTAMGFLLGKMTSHGVLKQLGLLLCKGTLCSLSIVLFVLPGLLFLFDSLIQKTTKGISFVNK